MSKELRNGKYYSNDCFNCGQSKASVEYHRKRKDPRYCVTVSSTEGGTEVDGEWDRHRFVITKKSYDAELEAENEWFKSMETMYDISPEEVK